MFNLARLKLTAWYLLMIMLVSAVFSTVIYQVETVELTRFATAQRFRIERRLVLFADPMPPAPSSLDIELVEEAKGRLLLFLLGINAGIFVISGGLGYFLAGRTLKPIKEMVEEQNRFVGDASHELRTPLTAIKSALEVNLKDKKLLRDCLEQVDKLQYLTESLLQVENQSLKFEKVSLLKIVESAIQTVKAKATQKGITIKNTGKNFSVNGDKYALTNLATILLDNAIKYSPDKTLVVVDIQNDILTVTDEGVGIEKKDLPHVFDRFYRADSARTKTRSGGYGLGLSIAKKIVEAHNGSISAQSEPGVGTTITVRFQNSKIS